MSLSTRGFPKRVLVKMKIIKPFLSLFIIVGVILIFSSPLFAFDPFSIIEAGPPRITEEGILFSFKSEKGTPNYVKVSGDFDNWNDAHLMIRNVNDVFVYLFKDTKGKGILVPGGKYRYRYLVDGIWMNDPKNSRTVYDQHGTELSYFEVTTPIILVNFNPVHIKNNSYIFYYKNEKVKWVNLVGEFNNWNPYSHPLKKTKSGFWEVEVDIPPGKYAYRFIIDGRYIKDPLGTKITFDKFNNEYSLLELPLYNKQK